MHVAVFNRSFYPDTAATGQLLTELCEGLVRDFGCRVSVVAGVPLIASNGSSNGSSDGLLISRENHHGIEIFRARGTRFSKKRFVGRFSNYVSYFLSACYAGLRLDRPDIIVAATDPPIIGLAGYLASRLFHVPFVMSYRDIFPEVAVLLEDFQSETVNNILHFINCFLVRNADRSIALGPTMREKLIQNKKAEPDKVVVIPDWADCTEILPGSKENRFSIEHDLADKFVVMHSGNIGLSQSLDSLIEAASYLKEHSDMVFVIVGEGVKKSRLQQQVRNLKLENVTFLPYQPKERLTESFAAADLFVVSLKCGMAGYIVPSKLYGILAAGRPFVAAVEDFSEVAAISAKYRCGLLAEPENGRDLAAKIKLLYANRSVCEEMGKNAREASFEFHRPVQIHSYHQLFEQLVSGEGIRK